MLRTIAVAALLTLASFSASARDLRIATWNLGWHLSQAEAREWIGRCGASFARNDASSRWEPAETGAPGWELRWGRDANILWDISALPPCDVFQVSFRAVPVTIEAYRKRAS